MSHKRITSMYLKNVIQSSNIKIGGLYYHYKNPSAPYMVLNVGLQENSHQPMVIYCPINDPKLIWIRPVSEWNQKITDGDQSYTRFTLKD